MIRSEDFFKHLKNYNSGAIYCQNLTLVLYSKYFTWIEQDVLVQKLCSSHIMLLLNSCTKIKTDVLKLHALKSAERTFQNDFCTHTCDRNFATHPLVCSFTSHLRKQYLFISTDLLTHCFVLAEVFLGSTSTAVSLKVTSPQFSIAPIWKSAIAIQSYLKREKTLDKKQVFMTFGMMFWDVILGHYHILGWQFIMII